ncbi:sel1 repeat family protein [Spiractinospora alimapuensis]|nr:sel1 repeat family protein [Spiractinospora alimapuensis]
MGHYADLLVDHQGDPGTAEEWYRRAIEGGSSADAISYGNLLFDAERYSEAEHWFRHAADHGHLAGRNNLANTLVELGRLPEAERTYRQAIDAGNVGAGFGYGMFLVKAGRDSEAEHWLRKAVEVEPNAHNTLGNALHNQGRLREAEEHYRKAADNGDTVGMYNLGILLADQGRDADARHWLTRARDGGDPDAADRLRELTDARRDPPPPGPPPPPPSAFSAASSETSRRDSKEPADDDDEGKVGLFFFAMVFVMLLGLVPVLQIPIGWAALGLWGWASGHVSSLPSPDFPGLFTGEGFRQVLSTGYFLVNVVGMGIGVVGGLVTRDKDYGDWALILGAFITCLVTFLILRG